MYNHREKLKLGLIPLKIDNFVKFLLKNHRTKLAKCLTDNFPKEGLEFVNIPKNAKDLVDILFSPIPPPPPTVLPSPPSPSLPPQKYRLLLPKNPLKSFKYPQLVMLDYPRKCNQKGCLHRPSSLSNFNRHLWQIHDINVNGKRKHYVCNTKDCLYKSKASSDRDRHLWLVHNINRTGNMETFKCNECLFETKLKSTLKNHKDRSHNKTKRKRKRKPTNPKKTRAKRNKLS